MTVLFDLSHTVGFDLSFDATGDLQLTQGREKGQQRLLRRLLTDTGTYLFHLDYGAGLPAQVGEQMDRQRLQTLIRRQLSQEVGIAVQPAPEMTVVPARDGVSVSLRYWEVATSQSVALSFQLDR